MSSTGLDTGDVAAPVPNSESNSNADSSSLASTSNPTSVTPTPNSNTSIGPGSASNRASGSAGGLAMGATPASSTTGESGDATASTSTGLTTAPIIRINTTAATSNNNTTNASSNTTTTTTTTGKATPIPVPANHSTPTPIPIPTTSTPAPSMYIPASSSPSLHPASVASYPMSALQPPKPATNTPTPSLASPGSYPPSSTHAAGAPFAPNGSAYPGQSWPYANGAFAYYHRYPVTDAAVGGLGVGIPPSMLSAPLSKAGTTSSTTMTTTTTPAAPALGVAAAVGSTTTASSVSGMKTKPSRKARAPRGSNARKAPLSGSASTSASTSVSAVTSTSASASASTSTRRPTRTTATEPLVRLGTPSRGSPLRLEVQSGPSTSGLGLSGSANASASVGVSRVSTPLRGEGDATSTDGGTPAKAGDVETVLGTNGNGSHDANSSTPTSGGGPNVTTTPAGREAYMHPDELSYVKREDWTQEGLVMYLCQNVFSVPGKVLPDDVLMRTDGGGTTTTTSAIPSQDSGEEIWNFMSDSRFLKTFTAVFVPAPRGGAGGSGQTSPVDSYSANATDATGASTNTTNGTDTTNPTKTARASHTPIFLPKAYRVPLMFVAKFQWESLRLVLTSAEPEGEWREFRFDVVHLSRLCSHLLKAARQAMLTTPPDVFGRLISLKGDRVGSVDRSWRCGMFDRALVRFYRRWMICREWSVKLFHEEFGEEEYQSDVLKHDWPRWVLKGHKGFLLTKDEVDNGISAEQFTAGLEFRNGKWMWDNDIFMAARASTKQVWTGGKGGLTAMDIAYGARLPDMNEHIATSVNGTVNGGRRHASDEAEGAGNGVNGATCEERKSVDVKSEDVEASLREMEDKVRERRGERDMDVEEEDVGPDVEPEEQHADESIVLVGTKRTREDVEDGPTPAVISEGGISRETTLGDGCSVDLPQGEERATKKARLSPEPSPAQEPPAPPLTEEPAAPLQVTPVPAPSEVAAPSATITTAEKSKGGDAMEVDPSSPSSSNSESSSEEDDDEDDDYEDSEQEEEGAGKVGLWGRVGRRTGLPVGTANGMNVDEKVEVSGKEEESAQEHDGGDQKTKNQVDVSNPPKEPPVPAVPENNEQTDELNPSNPSEEPPVPTPPPSSASRSASLGLRKSPTNTSGPISAAANAAASNATNGVCVSPARPRHTPHLSATQQLLIKPVLRRDSSSDKGTTSPTAPGTPVVVSGVELQPGESPNGPPSNPATSAGTTTTSAAIRRPATSAATSASAGVGIGGTVPPRKIGAAARTLMGGARPRLVAGSARVAAAIGNTAASANSAGGLASTPSPAFTLPLASHADNDAASTPELSLGSQLNTAVKQIVDTLSKLLKDHQRIVLERLPSTGSVVATTSNGAKKSVLEPETTKILEALLGLLEGNQRISGMVETSHAVSTNTLAEIKVQLDDLKARFDALSTVQSELHVSSERRLIEGQAAHTARVEAKQAEMERKFEAQNAEVAKVANAIHASMKSTGDAVEGVAQEVRNVVGVVNQGLQGLRDDVKRLGERMKALEARPVQVLPSPPTSSTPTDKGKGRAITRTDDDQDSEEEDGEVQKKKGNPALVRKVMDVMRNMADILEYTEDERGPPPPMSTALTIVNPSSKGKERERETSTTTRAGDDGYALTRPSESTLFSAILDEMRGIREELRTSDKRSKEELATLRLLHGAELESIRRSVREGEENARKETQRWIDHRLEVMIEDRLGRRPELAPSTSFGGDASTSAELVELKRRLAYLEAKERQESVANSPADALSPLERRRERSDSIASSSNDIYEPPPAPGPSASSASSAREWDQPPPVPPRHLSGFGSGIRLGYNGGSGSVVPSRKPSINELLGGGVSTPPLPVKTQRKAMMALARQPPPE